MSGTNRLRRSLAPTSQMSDKDVMILPDLEKRFLDDLRRYHEPLESIQLRESGQQQALPSPAARSCSSSAGWD